MSDMPWFRCWNDSASDVKLAAIAEELDKNYHEVLGAWVMILCIASQSPDRGKLLVTFRKRFTLNGIARYMKLNNDDTEVWIDKFMEMSLLGIENGVYYIVNWQKRQPKSDNSTLRVKKWREEKKQTEDCNVSETLPFNSDSDSISSSLLNIFKEYESEIGMLTSTIRDKLIEAEKDYETVWIEKAIKEAATHNARNWAYVEACLKNWKANGFQSRKNGSKPHEPNVFDQARAKYGIGDK